MCRMTAAAATVLALVVASGGLVSGAHAADKAPKGDKTVAANPSTLTATPQQPAAPRAKATPQQRAEIARMDPLSRAAFWSNEVQADGRDAEAGVYLAQALRTLGRYDEAASTAGAVLVMDPNNMGALLEVARAQVERGQGFYAIEPAARAAKLAPKDWRPVSLLAIAYEQTQRDAEALEAHKAALALAPDEPGALTNLALFQAGHGDLAAAEALLRRAATLPSSTPQVRQNLAMVLGLQGRFDEAETLARRDLPPEQANSNLALLRAAKGPPTTGGAGRSWDAMRAQ
jgi:Flp pilus assembly protein TadD